MNTRDANLRRDKVKQITTANIIGTVQRRKAVTAVLLKILVFWSMTLCFCLFGLLDIDYEGIRIFRNVGKH